MNKAYLIYIDSDGYDLLTPEPISPSEFHLAINQLTPDEISYFAQDDFSDESEDAFLTEIDTEDTEISSSFKFVAVVPEDWVDPENPLESFKDQYPTISGIAQNLEIYEI